MPTLTSDGRRKRYQVSQSKKKLSITDRDLDLLLALQRHGILSTSYLAKFYQGNSAWMVSRLTDLVNDVPKGMKTQILFRPSGQWESRFCLYNECFYSLTPEGRRFLAREGLAEDPIRPTGWFGHQMMTSAVTASMEIAAKDNGIEYIPGHRVLKGKSLAYEKKLVPDQLFQLKYPNGTYRTFAVECDRGNERVEDTIKARRHNNKSLESSYKAYKDFIGSPGYRPYQEHYGIKSGLLVLNIMTNPNKMQSILQTIGQSNFMLYQHVEGFERAFRTPKLMPRLLTGDWLRPGTEPFCIGQ